MLSEARTIGIARAKNSEYWFHVFFQDVEDKTADIFLRHDIHCGSKKRANFGGL